MNKRFCSFSGQSAFGDKNPYKAAAPRGGSAGALSPGAARCRPSAQNQSPTQARTPKSVGSQAPYPGSFICSHYLLPQPQPRGRTSQGIQDGEKSQKVLEAKWSKKRKAKHDGNRQNFVIKNEFPEVSATFGGGEGEEDSSPPLLTRTTTSPGHRTSPRPWPTAAARGASLRFRHPAAAGARGKKLFASHISWEMTTTRANSRLYTAGCRTDHCTD